MNYRFKQDPGDFNSLGSMRINFPSKDGVYMHDTPSKGLFGEDMRFHSSGCVRVQNVRELVNWLLVETPGWSRQEIDAVIKSGERKDAKVAKPVPLYWVYVTAWATPDGVTQFREDIYNRDGLGPVAATSAAHLALSSARCAHARGATFVPEQLDRAHRLRVRHGADAHLHQIALVAERLVLAQDFLDHLLAGCRRRDGRAAMQPGVELRARGRRPAALAADVGHLRGVARKEFVGGRLRGVGDIAVGVDADRQRAASWPAWFAASRNRSTNGAKRSGMPPMMASAIGRPSDAGADRRRRIAADRDPDRNRVRRARIDRLVVQRRAVLARPCDALVVADFHQQFELLGEQLVVVVEVVAEQRKATR